MCIKYDKIIKNLDCQKKFGQKKILKNVLKKTGKKNLICVNVSQKMMIYHKMSMSGVYENVFQTSENYC